MAVFGNNILITFDMLVDTDIGLLNLIKNKYNDPSVFNQDILKLDDEDIKKLLRENETNNALDIFMTEFNPIQSNAFKKEFMELEYSDIIVLSCETTLLDMVRKFIATNGTIITSILCKNNIEVDRVKQLLSDHDTKAAYNIVLETEVNENMSLYDTIFIKYIDNLVFLSDIDIIGKNIMISDLKCNLDFDAYKRGSKIPKLDIASIYAETNQFYTVTLYYYDYKDTNNAEDLDNEYSED